MAKKSASSTVSIKNKKASFEYEFIDEFEAGIQLTGTEIKSLREGKASIKEGYCIFKNAELYLKNANISPYAEGSYNNHEPLRDRKLLLHKYEIEKLSKKLKDVGLTIIPIKMYLNEKGWAKLKIALAKGKKMYDKRQDLKQKDDRRQMDRMMKK